MKHEIKITTLLVLLVSAYGSFAQSLSNKGKEFWVGYGHHQFMEQSNDNSQEMVLYFSAEEQEARVTVSIVGTSYSETYRVPANSVVQSKLIPKGLASGTLIDARLYTRAPDYPGGTGSEGIFSNKGIHIESDVPIVAYAHIYGGLASGASMLMPVETWGYSYVALNTRQTFNTNGKGDCFSWIYVVAKENNTRVKIVPRVDTRNGRPANVPFTIDLKKGEIFQMLGALIDVNNGYDLTGTMINSITNDQGECFPIAVFVGSSRTAITCDMTSTGSGDNIMQQMFPYQAWGKRYLTAPTSSQISAQTNNINIFRIAVKDQTTIVKKNGQRLFGLNGFFYEYQSNQADYIEADKPILVAQYIPSSNSCSYVGDGDPELMYLSPIEQSIKHIGFYRNTKAAINVNYLTLIIPTNGINSLTIDGARNAYTHTYLHPNLPGYSVVVKRWTAASAQCIVESDSAFTAITYGLGVAESYGYNAGTLFNNLSGLPEIRNVYNTSTVSNKYTCVNTPVKLSVLMRYQPTKMHWKLSALAGKLSPAVDIIDNAPVSSGTQVINGMTYYRYTLPQDYTYNTAGFYRIPLITTHPSVETCNKSEEINYEVEVKAALKADYAIAFTNCNAEATINFTGNDKFENDDSVAKWNWIFPDALVTSGKAVQHLFQAGDHKVKMLAISKEGCVADTSKSFTLSNKPVTPDFAWNAISCEGETVTFTDKAVEPGVVKWYWDLGDKDTISSNTSAPQKKQFESYGAYTIKHVAQFANGCSSDTAKQVITIFAKPALRIEYPDSCLKDGIVTFKSMSAAADGQAMDPAGYLWDFGDGEAGPGNPNTIAIADASHRFGTRSYSISYSAATVNGCKKDTLFTTTFKLQPQLTYAALTNVCESLTSTASVASAAIINGVAGAGVYRGRATDAAGNFTPTEAGPGRHTIWYVYTSTGGCTDSISQTLTVYPKPIIDAGNSFAVAKGEPIRFQAHAADSLQLSYNWSPATGLSDPRILQPSLVVLQDQQYVLTATNEYNCQASDFLRVKVLKQLNIPNVFSPNGDGINDRWEIVNLVDYADATVQVFNRYGQLVFSSKGYATPWDGSQNGKPLPVGTYYYVIDCKEGSAPVSGSVTILK